MKCEREKIKMLTQLNNREQRTRNHKDHNRTDLKIMLSSLLILLIVVGFLVLFPARDFSSNSCQQAYQSEAISLRGKNISYTYLKSIDNYFLGSASPVAIYIPRSYKVSRDEHLWHFGDTERNSGKVTTVVFTSCNVKSFQLLMQSRQTTITITYSLNSSSHPHAVKKSSRSPFLEKMRNRRTKEHFFSGRMHLFDKNTNVADISKDVKPWLSRNWRMTIKMLRLKSCNTSYEENYPMPPVLCIEQYKPRMADEKPLHNILKSFLVNKINDEISKIPNKYQEKHPQLRKKRSAALECQMNKLEMSFDDIGLAKVILPRQVSLTYCQGTCHVLDDPALFTINALARAKYTFLFGNNKVPSPQCVPTHFRPLPFFIQLRDQIRRVAFEDLDVTRCGCR